MQMIEKMGYVDYFLIVADFVAFARRAGIPVGPGRGSAAGAIVSYCLYITDLDPMKYGLVFERFLNPERVSMPDIDMDFCQNRRGEVIDYVMEKYGADHVAQIVTFGTMAARGAIRDVGRALNFTYAETDAVAKLVPTMPLHITLEEALKASPQLKAMYEGDERIRRLIDMARAMEGMPRNTSTHAAGVVITRLPVYDYVPLARNDDTIVTQYTMTTLEELGLLKMDFLGLRNLTVIDDADPGHPPDEPDFDIQHVPDDDRATFAMLAEGRTAGVFQMESAGITAVCTGMQPESIEDLTAIVALYRPGPMDSIPKFIRSKQNPASHHLPPSQAGAHFIGHLRVYRISGAGHRDLPPAGRLYPGPGGQYAPCHLQEEAGGHPGRAPAPLSTEIPSGGSPAPSPAVWMSRRRRPSTTRSWTLPTTPSTRPTPCAMPW